MKRILFAAALFAVLPFAAGAQVEKQVEVTKNYVPSVENAAKLAVVPDMTDTVKMRPEIDYSVTPLSLQTTLATRPIRPATVTYWEFNRPRTFYLKAGAGYPLNSVFDFYASSQNPGTGYVVGYINHEGRFGEIRDNLDKLTNATRMFNRVGAAAGKYFGKRVLEADLSYDNRMYNRFTGITPVSEELRRKLDYGEADLALRFGDDFKDLSRFNFEVALRGNYFIDHSEVRKKFPQDAGRGNQLTVDVAAKIAKAFGRHRFGLEVGYEAMKGLESYDPYKQSIIRAGLRYGIDGGLVKLEAGADYYHDAIGVKYFGTDGADGTFDGNYIIPFLRFGLNLGTPGLKPFIELDGGVRTNDFRSMTYLNPYFASRVVGSKSSVDYNGRLGVAGSLWRDKFTYRLFAGFSVRDNHPYLTGEQMYATIQGTTGPKLIDAGVLMSPVFARQTVTSFNAEVTYRPLNSLKILLGAHGYLYNDDTKYFNGEPAFDGNVKVQYDGRKISFGVEAVLQTSRKWSLLNRPDGVNVSYDDNTIEAPTAVDVRVNFDWRVGHSITLFAEGRNLANSRLYEFALYPEYGANFTLGIKANF